MNAGSGPARRQLIVGLGLGLAASLYALLPRQLSAMSKLPSGRSIYRIRGTVLVNGQAADKETLIRAGDTVETKGGGGVVFALGASAFMMRENTHLELEGSEKVVRLLRVVTGKLLSVYGEGERRLTTPIVNLGIRGTGVYVEVESQRTYVCTCYGTVDISATDDPTRRETVTTTHHEAPRYISVTPGQVPTITPAPVINHTDLELVLLESLVGRKPPFASADEDSY